MQDRVVELRRRVALVLTGDVREDSGRVQRLR